MGTLAITFANLLEKQTAKKFVFLKNPGKYYRLPVSIKHGLRTADYGLRTGYKTRTRYKTRTGKYGLGIKHGLGTKRGLRTVDYGLGTKYGLGIKCGLENTDVV